MNAKQRREKRKSDKCSDCQGIGRVKSQNCFKCKGTGKTKTPERPKKP